MNLPKSVFRPAAEFRSPQPGGIPIAARRRRRETAEQMRLAECDVLAARGRCGLVVRVDLAILIRLLGGPRV